MMIIKKALPPLLATLLSITAIGSAHAAGTLSGEIAVKLEIGAGCTVANGTVTGGVNHWGTMDFGTQSNLVSAVDAGIIGVSSSAVTISCSNGVTSSLKLNGGQYGNGTLRNMSSDGTTRVPYRLYSNSARSTEINVDTAIPLISNGTAQNIPIYGRIVPADQTNTAPTPGTYNDTILATLSW